MTATRSTAHNQLRPERAILQHVARATVVSELFGRFRGFMERTRIAVGPKVQTERFDRITHAKGFAVVNGVLTAFEFLFGCRHRKVSRPFTLSGWTYEVCLTCGRKFAYNRAEIGFGVPKQVQFVLEGHCRTKAAQELR